MLSEEEKNELYNLSKSEKLKNDFRQINKNRNAHKSFSADDFIQFLSVMNDFFNHPIKPFRKIEGKFIL